jgi:nitrogen fixation protein FixH
MNKKILLKTLLPISTIALLGGGIASSLTLTSCSKKSEKALEINVLTSTITRNGVKLDIEGSYSTFNFDSPTIELVDKENSFKPFEASNGIFIATLPANTDIGTYKLQLVAKNGDDNIYSNTITFIVGPFAASDGSN